MEGAGFGNAILQSDNVYTQHVNTHPVLDSVLFQIVDVLPSVTPVRSSIGDTHL